MWKLTPVSVTSCRCLTSSVPLTCQPWCQVTPAGWTCCCHPQLTALSPASQWRSPHTIFITRDDTRGREEATYSSGQSLTTLRQNYLLICEMSKFGTGLTENQVKRRQSVSSSCFSRCHPQHSISCTSAGCVGTCLPWAPAILQGCCLSLLLLHSLLCGSHTECEPWATLAQYNSRTIHSKCWWPEGENPLPLDPSSGCFEINASRKMRQIPWFCQSPLCSVLTEPSWVPVSRWGNVSWSAAYRLLHKNSLFAYSARDAALRMLLSHSKYSMTTIRATGAESLKGGRETKERKQLFSRLSLML